MPRAKGKPVKVRTVYLLREAEGNGTSAQAPQVHIEMTAKREITYGVRVSNSTLGIARIEAERQFRLLRDYARKLADPIAPPAPEGSDAKA